MTVSEELKAAEASSHFKPWGVASRGKGKLFGTQETSFRCSVCHLLGCECILGNGRVSLPNAIELFGHKINDTF